MVWIFIYECTICSINFDFLQILESLRYRMVILLLFRQQKNVIFVFYYYSSRKCDKSLFFYCKLLYRTATTSIKTKACDIISLVLHPYHPTKFQPKLNLEFIKLVKHNYKRYVTFL